MFQTNEYILMKIQKVQIIANIFEKKPKEQRQFHGQKAVIFREMD